MRQLQLPDDCGALVLLANVDVADGEIPFHPGAADVRWMVEQARERLGEDGWPPVLQNSDVEVDRVEHQEALANCTRLLGQDLAYSSVALAALKNIADTVHELVGWVGSPHFWFSNMAVSEDGLGVRWNPISGATFDGCVLITSRDRVAAVLQFSED